MTATGLGETKPLDNNVSSKIWLYYIMFSVVFTSLTRSANWPPPPPITKKSKQEQTVHKLQIYTFVTFVSDVCLMCADLSAFAKSSFFDFFSSKISSEMNSSHHFYWSSFLGNPIIADLRALRLFSLLFSSIIDL